MMIAAQGVMTAQLAKTATKPLRALFKQWSDYKLFPHLQCFQDQISEHGQNTTQAMFLMNCRCILHQISVTDFIPTINWSVICLYPIAIFLPSSVIMIFPAMT